MGRGASSYEMRLSDKESRTMKHKKALLRMTVRAFRATVKATIYAARHVWKAISLSLSRLKGRDGRTSFLISPF